MNMFDETNKMIVQRMQILDSVSRQTVLILTEGRYTFTSTTTQERYTIRGTDPTLVRPILKQKKTFLVESILNLNEEPATLEYILNKLSTNRQSGVDVAGSEQLILHLATLYTDNIEGIGKMLVDSNIYEDLLKKHKGIKELFIDNIFSGTTDSPTASARDFIKLGLYKNKDTNELVLLTNYTLNKRFQNKFGMLSLGNRPNDCNFLVLLGLVPAFIPDFKERLTEDEKNFFKLLTTPTKLFHERSSAVLYIQVISTPAYDSIVRDQKVERMREQFRIQEERLYNENVRLATRDVENLVNRLKEAEYRLIAAEKEMTYYTAGGSKLEDAVSYILEHTYLIDVNYDNSKLSCSFRAPLSQWDPEIAATILKGLKENQDRYEINSSYATDIKKFMQYILIEQVAKYWLLAEFYIDLNTFSWGIQKLYWNSGIHANVFQPEKLLINKAGINPHMEYHSCVGSYRVQIEKAQQRKDLPGLIESILAPYKCWNLTDGTVAGKMFRYVIPELVRYNIPCIEYKGTVLDLRSFYKQLEDDRKPKVEPIPEAPKKRTRKPKVLGEQDHAADATRVVVDQARTFNTDINFDDVPDGILEETLRAQAETQGGEDNGN